MRFSRASWRLKRQPAPGRVWLFTAVVAAIGAGLAVAVSRTSAVPNDGHRIPWPLITLALVLIQMVPVNFHTGRQTHSVDLFGLPLILGVVFTPPGDLLLAVLAAAVVCSLQRREPVIRIVFNLANQVAAAGTALIVMKALLGRTLPVNPGGWVALFTATLTYEVATAAGVLVVVALASGGLDWGYVRRVGVQIGLVLPVNSALGIVAVAVYWTQPLTLLLMAGPCFALALWYRSANAMRNRLDDVQSLYGFTIKLTEVSARGEVLAVALEEARSILHCHHAELCIPEREGGFRYSSNGRQRLVRERADDVSLERQVIEQRTPAFIQRGRENAHASRRGFTGLIAVPISVGEEKMGTLLVADRQGDTETFARDDLRLLEALGAHLSTALTSSARLDRLRHEVAAREHEASHDSLTGLPNRSYFRDSLSAALSRRKQSEVIAVMLMDLDGFKEINDTLGHYAGDLILKEVGVRVRDAVGLQHMAARLGGDEFAFMVTAEHIQAVERAARKVLSAVSDPLSLSGMALSLRASIGVAIAPVHGSEPSALLKRADVAMYAAKSTGQGMVVYAADIDRNSTRRLKIASELRTAIGANQLEVWYQPIAALATGQVRGFEALLRWHHDEYGPISPNEFIPVAEQTGLIDDLTWWVLQTSLEELRGWLDNGYEMTVSVNVSTRSLLDSGFVERLRTMLENIDVGPQNLTLEITESSMMLDPDRSERILTELSALGVSIAIDDFGTGYSSLSRLKRLPVHIVKIDRSFVKHLCDDEGDEAIVRSTIQLARNMGHSVVAEGVEDLATWNRLVELGCQQAQGYFLSRAIPALQCREWLYARQAPAIAEIRPLRPVAQGA